ncbi:MAG: acyl-CoA dehydrogenase family protein [Deltaproteobacteria bacterium]|nr:acyl-CoA dehydrogenase family protein [Deltaproteobacteria bacterium]
MSQYDKFRAPGLSYLLVPCGSVPVFAPEYFDEDQRMIQKTALDFIVKDVQPRDAELEAKKEGVLPGLLKKAGELGLLAVDVPEEYGGLGADKTTSNVVAESLVGQGSFMVGHATHTGIGTLPIVYFGTPEQKGQYLPRLASGELLGYYALTEAGSGSDALGAKCRAVLSADGKEWILNGEKQFITNVGFADVGTVFAKIDGEKFTGFLVELKGPGVSTGAEEHKMGIHGSSTRSLIFEDARIPRANLLGKEGEGHKIAFNILNLGRLKLGLACSGGCKFLIRESALYANQRKQFGIPIAKFHAIKEKLALMAARTFAVESMGYRTTGAIDAIVATIDKKAPDGADRVVKAIEEFAVEASILKVAGSEALWYCADEGVQIHGGYGFIAEYAVERAYRDCRVNRIFEGTNEINRMLIPGTILKRAMKGQFDLMGALGKITEEAKDPAKLPRPGNGPLAEEAHVVDLLKRGVLFAANHAVMKHMADLQKQQMLLMAMADMMMEAYAVDSSVARARQIAMEQGEAKARIPALLARIYLANAVRAVRQRAEDLLVNVLDDAELAEALEGMHRFLGLYRFKTMPAKVAVADHLLERERYTLE